VVCSCLWLALTQFAPGVIELLEIGVCFCRTSVPLHLLPHCLVPLTGTKGCGSSTASPGCLSDPHWIRCYIACFCHSAGYLIVTLHCVPCSHGTMGLWEVGGYILFSFLSLASCIAFDIHYLLHKLLNEQMPSTSCISRQHSGIPNF
jgi:hypothetical protein